MNISKNEPIHTHNILAHSIKIQIKDATLKPKKLIEVTRRMGVMKKKAKISQNLMLNLARDAKHFIQYFLYQDLDIFLIRLQFREATKR